MFIPDHNLRAKAKVQPIGDRQLKVSGCAFRIICRTEFWNRTEQPLPE